MRLWIGCFCIALQVVSYSSVLSVNGFLDLCYRRGQDSADSGNDPCPSPGIEAQADAEKDRYNYHPIDHNNIDAFFHVGILQVF